MDVTASRLDLKLGLRQSLKHPVSSLVALVATSFAIAAGATYFEIVADLVHPKLPLAEGDRVVEIRNEDLATATVERRSLHDFLAWREELTSIEDLAAYSTYTAGVALPGGAAEPHEVVAISAAAFRVARIPPLLGRPLVDGDEAPGARPVAVLGERLWALRFDRDPAVIGRSIEIAGTPHLVVGVMPESFALPVHHQLWTPLAIASPPPAPRDGRSIGTLGRLAPDVTLAAAQAELEALGVRRAKELPETHSRLRPRVAPYLERFTPEPGEGALRLGVNAIFLILLALICGNVGALFFARIVGRERELSIRTALGASRRRIVTLLFAEAMVIATLSALVGLAVAAWVVSRGEAFLANVQGTALPFWRDGALGPTTVLYVVALAVAGAFFMGAVPAMRFTRGDVETSLRRTAIGESASPRLSARVIVLQVAVACALLPIAVSGALHLSWSQPTVPGVRPEEFLALELGFADPPEASVGSEGAARRSLAPVVALRERILSEPRFAAAAFTDRLPGSTHLPRPIEIAAASGGAAAGARSARVATVDPDFFATFDAAPVAGRGFQPSDLEAAREVAVVNESFVASMLGGRQAIGERVRLLSPGAAEPGPWLEIVGVVPDLGMNPLRPDRGAGLYRLARPEDVRAGFLAIRLAAGGPGAAERARFLATSLDESVLVYGVSRLDQLADPELRLDRAFAALVIGATAFLVLLSAAVTFALMSFTVGRRRREVGIIRALGAGPRAVLARLFSRAILQLGLGAALGASSAFFLLSRAPGATLDVETGLGVVSVVLGVGLLACGPPALRALRIEPIVAMKDDL